MSQSFSVLLLSGVVILSVLFVGNVVSILEKKNKSEFVEWLSVFLSGPIVGIGSIAIFYLLVKLLNILIG